MKTLSHDRDVEWGWLSLKLKNATDFPRQHALDFGPMPGGPTIQLAIDRGYAVTGIGLERIKFSDPNFKYIQQDINAVARPGLFNVIINISTIEHVGLGRYGDPIDPDADIKTMRRLRNWMRMGGCHILTLPVGVDAVIGNYHRVYGDMRLWQLLDGWAIQEQKYWRKNDADEWEICTKEEALAEKPTHLPVESLLHLYTALGGFVLGG